MTIAEQVKTIVEADVAANGSLTNPSFRIWSSGELLTVRVVVTTDETKYTVERPKRCVASGTL